MKKLLTPSRLLLMSFPFMFGLLTQWAHAEVLSFPPEPCAESWKDLAPETYSYSSSRDSTYENYVTRLNEAQIFRSQCHKTWTVLVYMVATPDLMSYALADIQEMEDQVKTMDLRSDVILQLDTPEDQLSRRYHIFSAPHERASPITEEETRRLTREDLRSPLISEDRQSLITTQSRRFRDFMKWAMKEYPSEYYMVIIWGHGQGWTSVQEGSAYGGLGRSEGLSYIDIPSLRKSLAEVSSWRGRPIEVFASDACLMESVEDVTELAGSADYVCGSEDIESYAGFPYGALISHLKTGSFDGASQKIRKSRYGYDEPYQVAWMIPQLYQESFDRKTGSQSSLDPYARYQLTGCTVSSKGVLSSLVPYLNQLGSHLTGLIQQHPDLKSTLLYLIQQNPSYEGGTQDLGLFLKSLADWTLSYSSSLDHSFQKSLEPLQRLISKTCYALRYSIISSALGQNYSQYEPSLGCAPLGLSIWLPQSQEDFNSRIGDFSESLFYKTCAGAEQESGWRAWMNELYSPSR